MKVSTSYGLRKGTASVKSWDVLTPTIRKEGSEIWITLNPDMETDETYRRFIAMPSEDTWLCEINWRDNPWFPEELNRERLKAQRSMSKEDYGNIWEGIPRMVSEGRFTGMKYRTLFIPDALRSSLMILLCPCIRFGIWAGTMP